MLATHCGSDWSIRYGVWVRLRSQDSPQIVNRSGFDIVSEKLIPHLRANTFWLDSEYTIPGDAPKDFLRAYEYGVAKKRNARAWPAHIAKLGHKWYPNESITEQLMTRVGQYFGVVVADTSLRRVHGEIRLLSRYFLGPAEQLVHGAEIIDSYVDEDGFVRALEHEREDRDMLTFQVVEEAMARVFPKACHGPLMDGFVTMLVFDAIVGNHDRHYLNWGVIRHATGRVPPRFAPVFDTARGMFWNWSDRKVVATALKPPNKRMEAVDAYIHQSKPKIGWDGERPNHIELVSMIAGHHPRYRDIVVKLLETQNASTLPATVEVAFSPLMHSRRLDLIVERLNGRLAYLREHVGV